MLCCARVLSRVLYFIVHIRRRHKESSRSLSHLLMSFLFLQVLLYLYLKKQVCMHFPCVEPVTLICLCIVQARHMQAAGAVGGIVFGKTSYVVFIGPLLTDTS